MKNVSIIGAGNLGTSLGCALSKKGYRIKALSCRRMFSANESSRIIGEGKPSRDNIKSARCGELIILSVPDDEIEKVVRELASSDIKWEKKFVFHCSGLLSSDVLKPLKKKGAMTASVHPIQSFAQKNEGPKAFEGIYFGLEGCMEARALAQQIVRELGSCYFNIQAKDKPLYHAACCIASNFLIVLLDAATFLLKVIGLKEHEASQALFPLVQGTLHNVKKFNISASLTGPIVRGDRKSLEKHLDALKDFPPYHEIYLRAAAQAVEIAKREKKLSSQKIKELEELLGEK